LSKYTLFNATTFMFQDPWFAIPKAPRHAPKPNPDNELWTIAWRLSFPIQERKIMNDLNYFKYTLRLIKQVRDQFRIHAVASYYIKTLFLWEIETQDLSVWVETPRGRLFMYMLVRFQQALTRGRIDFYWDKECNLIEHIGKDYLANNANQVSNFIEKIENYIDNDNLRPLKSLIIKKLCPVILECNGELWGEFDNQEGILIRIIRSIWRRVRQSEWNLPTEWIYCAIICLVFLVYLIVMGNQDELWEQVAWLKTMTS